MTPTNLSCKDIKITSALPTPNSLTKSTIIQCDNESAIKLAKNPVFHARSKHIGIQHHFLGNK